MVSDWRKAAYSVTEPDLQLLPKPKHLAPNMRGSVRERRETVEKEVVGVDPEELTDQAKQGK